MLCKYPPPSPQQSSQTLNADLRGYISSLPTSDTSRRIFGSPARRDTIQITPLYCPLEPVQSLSSIIEYPGFIRLSLMKNIVLDLSYNMAVRLLNYRMNSSFYIASSSKQISLLHPTGRILAYEPRVEIQCEDEVGVKNAKFFPNGISFTSNNKALVFCLDEAGTRSMQQT